MHNYTSSDILCSMPKVFTDLEYTVCIYVTGNIIDNNENTWTSESQPHAYETCGNGSSAFVFWRVLLSLLPYYLRLMQSLRVYFVTRRVKHLFNALKYFMSMTVGILATVKQIFFGESYLITIWLYVSVVTTLYCLYWDVVMDWGLGEFRAEHFFLRSSDTLFFPPYLYYCAILLDALFRLGWAIYISPGNMVLQQHFILLLGCVELVRRFVWSIFRVEWEHVCILSEEAVQQRRAKRFNEVMNDGAGGQLNSPHVSVSMDSFFLRHESDPELQNAEDDNVNRHKLSQDSDLESYWNEYVVELTIPEDAFSEESSLLGDGPGRYYQASGVSAPQTMEEGLSNNNTLTYSPGATSRPRAPSLHKVSVQLKSSLKKQSSFRKS